MRTLLSAEFFGRRHCHDSNLKRSVSLPVSVVAHSPHHNETLLISPEEPFTKDRILFKVFTIASVNQTVSGVW